MAPHRPRNSAVGEDELAPPPKFCVMMIMMPFCNQDSFVICTEMIETNIAISIAAVGIIVIATTVVIISVSLLSLPLQFMLLLP